MLWEIFPAFGESVESSNSSEWHWMRNLLRNSMCLLRMKSRPLLQNDTEWEILWEICPVFIHRIVHFFRMTLYEKCFEKYSLYWEWRVVHFFRMTLDEKFFEKYSLCLLRMKFTSSDSEWHNKKCFEKYSLCLLRVKSRSLLYNDTEWEMLWEICSVFIEESFTSSEWYWMRNVLRNMPCVYSEWRVVHFFRMTQMRNVLRNIPCVYWEWIVIHFFRMTLNEKCFEKYSLCLLRVKSRSLL